MGDVLDDLVRLLLAQGELVARGVVCANHVDEGIHGERVVLARDGEAGHGLGVAFVTLLEQVRLFEDLAGVAEERLALGGGHHALARPVEHGDPHLALQVAHGGCHARLRHEQAPCRLGDAATRGHLDDVSELLEFHGLPLIDGGVHRSREHFTALQSNFTPKGAHMVKQTAGRDALVLRAHGRHADGSPHLRRGRVRAKSWRCSRSVSPPQFRDSP